MSMPDPQFCVGELVSRGKGRRTDYVLYYKPDLPVALIEAKDNNYVA